MNLSSKEIKKIEQTAVDEGITWLELMENAGNAAAEVIQQHFNIADKQVVILCGQGNNGGDGFVIARKFHEAGAIVTVILTSGKPHTEQAKSMLSHYISVSTLAPLDLQSDSDLAATAILNASLIIDAVYGIGFHGDLPEQLKQLFRKINKIAVPVVAIDIPSGLEADTAKWDSDTLKAKLTITFIAPKYSLEASETKELYGKVSVASIGIDPPILKPYHINETSAITMEMVQKCFSPRAEDSNKGTFGRVLLFCGSQGMAGAAVLSTLASLRCGAGLAELALPASLYPIAATQLREPIFTLLEETTVGTYSQNAFDTLLQRIKFASSLALGCGLGQSPSAEQMVLGCLKQAICPIVLDADGLNILSKHLDILKEVHAPLIITPHPGEMSRLTGKTISEIQENRVETARCFAEQHQITVILKGKGTVIAVPDHTPFINPTGNSGMATGGTGDVLTGMIASFLAQGMSSYEASLCGVYLHGMAGDYAAARLSQHAMLASDLIEELPNLFLRLES